MTASLLITYDPNDRTEAARVAGIVRGDDIELRRAAWELRERLRRVMRGKESAEIDALAAEVVLEWLDEAFDGVLLSLEE